MTKTIFELVVLQKARYFFPFFCIYSNAKHQLALQQLQDYFKNNDF